MRLWVVLALWPLAAQAQPAYDALILDTCAQGTAPAQWDRCVGHGAARCMAEPGGSTTVGMGACLDAEFRQWDDLLNSAYGALRTREADADRQAPGAPSAAEALLQMQRAWIAYRDAACAYERSQWGGGTGGGPAQTGCLLDLTAKQAIALATRVHSAQQY